jgi:transposase
MQDLYETAREFVARALMQVVGQETGRVFIYDLVETFKVPTSAENFKDARDAAKDDFGARPSVAEVKEYLLRAAVWEINAQNPDALLFGGDADIDTVEGRAACGEVGLAEGVDAEALTFGAEPIIVDRALPDLFNPESGKWALSNPRDTTSKAAQKADRDLRAAMLGAGFMRTKPIIVDENGVVLSGHRREAMALKLTEEFPDRKDLAPIYETLKKATVGEKVWEALNSNYGILGTTPADRKQQAVDLTLRGWNIADIADKLAVSEMSVYRYIKDITPVKLPPGKAKRGRPAKTEAQRQAEAAAKAEAQRQEVVTTEAERIAAEASERIATEAFWAQRLAAEAQPGPRDGITAQNDSEEPAPAEERSPRKRAIDALRDSTTGNIPVTTLFDIITEVTGNAAPELAGWLANAVTKKWGSWAAFDKDRCAFNAKAADDQRYLAHQLTNATAEIA